MSPIEAVKMTIVIHRLATWAPVGSTCATVVRGSMDHLPSGLCGCGPDLTARLTAMVVMMVARAR